MGGGLLMSLHAMALAGGVAVSVLFGLAVLGVSPPGMSTLTYVMVINVLVVFPMGLLASRLRRRRLMEIRFIDGRVCTRCGYTLEEEQDGRPCPECGVGVDLAACRRFWIRVAGGRTQWPAEPGKPPNMFRREPRY
jgi:predicted RNA-binding Zn-ribbon protein involved in translation (DUF1610 family)